MLIVGLGNPGPKYDATRHNVGFMVVDELARSHGGGAWQQKFKAEFTKVRIGRTGAILLKPQTYMNLSGQSVSRAAGFFKCDTSDILVIHDDIDLDYGIVRVKSGGGTGGHKGIDSCKKELGGAQFQRIRIGVGRPQHGDVSDFVLKPFTPDEQISLSAVIDKACKATRCITSSGIVMAMNQFNQRQGDNQ